MTTSSVASAPVSTAPASIAEVIARMQAILHPLAATDGVACFTRLYLDVTEGVQAQLGALSFSDPAFIADLDVRFANLYFDAVEETAKPGGGTVPRAWAPLFESRGRRGVAPLQFAIAGMNAHINRDLPLAVVASCRHAGVAPDEGSSLHADYLLINRLLATVEARIKEQYLSGWLHRLDRAVHRVHRLDDIVAMWNIDRARDAAWTNAEALWRLRDDPELTSRYVAALDRSVGLAGRALLTPADTWVGRVGRFLHLG
jgi:Family of unknown function (DUF5995)